MIITWIVIAVVLGISILPLFCTDTRCTDTRSLRRKLNWCVLWLVMTGTVGGGCLGLAVLGSWNTYADTRAAYDVTLKQYRDAITMYEDRVVVNVQKAAMTDFVYNGYQGNIASFVKDLRQGVVWYNKLIVRKRLYHGNPFFSWLIVAPDPDMKVVELIDTEEDNR